MKIRLLVVCCVFLPLGSAVASDEKEKVAEAARIEAYIACMKRHPLEQAGWNQEALEDCFDLGMKISYVRGLVEDINTIRMQRDILRKQGKSLQEQNKEISAIQQEIDRKVLYGNAEKKLGQYGLWALRDMFGQISSYMRDAVYLGGKPFDEANANLFAAYDEWLERQKKSQNK